MSAPTPVHARLRAATADLHARLDASLCIAQVPVTLEACRRHLRACVGFYGPLEARWIPIAACEPSLAALALDDRRKLPLLQEDLAALDDREATPLCDDLPTIQSADDCWGLLYVLEGATLGGTVLQSRLARQLPMLPPLQFLSGYGSATGARWRAFLEQLDVAHRAGSVDVARAERSATATFTSLLRWFTRRDCVVPA